MHRNRVIIDEQGRVRPQVPRRHGRNSRGIISAKRMRPAWTPRFPVNTARHNRRAHVSTKRRTRRRSERVPAGYNNQIEQRMQQALAKFKTTRTRGRMRRQSKRHHSEFPTGASRRGVVAVTVVAANPRQLEHRHLQRHHNQGPHSGQLPIRILGPQLWSQLCAQTHRQLF